MPIPIDIILLAAGKSTRFGSNKLLAPVGDKALLSHILGELKKVTDSRLALVTGFQADLVKQHIGPGISMIHNPAFENGMTSSIQAGITALPEDSIGAMILPADLPFVDSRTLSEMIEQFCLLVPQNPQAIVAAADHGKLKNPVIFSSFFYPQILAHQNPNGCKQIVEQNREYVVSFEVKNPYFFRDIDTPEDYAALVDETTRRNH